MDITDRKHRLIVSYVLKMLKNIHKNGKRYEVYGVYGKKIYVRVKPKDIKLKVVRKGNYVFYIDLRDIEVYVNDYLDKNISLGLLSDDVNLLVFQYPLIKIIFKDNGLNFYTFGGMKFTKKNFVKRAEDLVDAMNIIERQTYIFINKF